MNKDNLKKIKQAGVLLGLEKEIDLIKDHTILTTNFMTKQAARDDVEMFRFLEYKEDFIANLKKLEELQIEHARIHKVIYSDFFIYPKEKEND